MCAWRTLLALLAGSDADRLLDGADEHLPVADLTRAGMLEDGLDHHGLVLVVDDDLELQLRPHVDGEGRAAVVLDDPFWRPEPLTSPIERRGNPLSSSSARIGSNASWRM